MRYGIYKLRFLKKYSIATYTYAAWIRSGRYDGAIRIGRPQRVRFTSVALATRRRQAAIAAAGSSYQVVRWKPEDLFATDASNACQYLENVAFSQRKETT